MKRLLVAGLLLTGCYSPDTPSNAFRCDATQKFLCPEGLFCDEDTSLCVKVPVHHDLGFPDMALAYDASVVLTARSCDVRVTAGAFSGLTNLGAVNSAADESSLVVTNDGSRIYYLSGGTLMTAPLTNAKTAGAPAAVTLNGLTSISGLAFASDGTPYAAGTTTIVDGAVDNQIFKLHQDSATQLTLVDGHQPAGLCTITDLAFTDGDITKDFYVAYPLAGCDMPDGRGSYIAQGTLDKQMGAFVAALPSFGYRSPNVVAGGLTMVLASVDPAARLYTASRPSTDAQWTGPASLSLSGIGGSGKRDAEGVATADCKTFYLASERTGGKGGLDLWAADIAAQ